MTTEVLDHVPGTNGDARPDGGGANRISSGLPASDTSLRLNLGSGHNELEGWKNLDRKRGQEVYPLNYHDGCADDLIASHVLEHFSHRDVHAVLKEWVRVLRPGGRIRLAVPDFADVARRYLADEPVHVQGYVMGGHVDADDRHGCIFDRDSLTEVMIDCGLERIGPWSEDLSGCAAGPHSLNLLGFKPSGPEKTLENVRAVMSTPRFGPLLHPKCAERAFLTLRIPARAGQSCFWHQKLSSLMEEAIAEESCEFVLTMDFDTVFSPDDVLELYRLLRACPAADAVFPLQSKRGCQEALFSLPDGKGGIRQAVTEADLARNLLPASTGHFGLTLFRASSLRNLPRPWMTPRPASDGTWDGTDHVDADIDFWRNWRKAGLSVFLAPRVVVGHLEEVVKWPGKDLRPFYQADQDYEENGIPAEVAR